MKRRTRKLRQMADRTLLLRDRRPEPVTEPIGRVWDPASPHPGRYLTAPAGPARLPEGADEPTIRTHTTGGQGWAMIVNEDAPAIPMDARVRKAHLSLQLAAEDLDTQGMLYRIDDAEQARQRGETIDERSVIALIVAKAVRHLMGPREPWNPAGWDHGVGTQPQPQPGPVVDVPWDGDAA